MKMLQSSKYVILGPSIYGASFTDGPSKGLQLYGSITCGYPIDPISSSLTYSNPSFLFEESSSGFYNLNNVRHGKVDGSVLACSGLTKTVPVSPSTVFGTMYRTTVGSRQWDYNVLVMPGESSYLYPCLEGNFNNAGYGFWCFGIGIAWLTADSYVAIMGDPDLKGSSKTGYYGFTAVKIEVGSTSFRLKYSTYSSPLRTSAFSPEVAFNLVREILRSSLEGAAWSSWKTYTIYNSINGSPLPLSLPSRFGSFDPDALFPLFDRNPSWGELARQAYNSVPFFNGNGIALSADLLSMKSSVSSTTSLIRSLINSNVTSKVIANIFLAFYYGWRLLVMDIGGVSSAFAKASSLNYRQKCSSHLTSEIKGRTYTSYFHCYYNRYGANRSGIDQLVSMFDAKLSLENIWDLIPFSFVIDWFISVGDLLESIDSFGSMTQDHTIVCTGRSIKCSEKRSAQTAGLSGWLGTVVYSYYERTYTPYVFFPSLILGELNNPLTHVIEGGALIVSKR